MILDPLAKLTWNGWCLMLFLPPPPVSISLAMRVFSNCVSTLSVIASKWTRSGAVMTISS